jgi:succinate-acetate transporter protein
MNDFLSSVGGRKFVLGVLALVAVCVLAIAEKITGDQALSTVTWVVGLVAGSIAIENVSTSITEKKTEEKP